MMKSPEVAKQSVGLTGEFSETILHAVFIFFILCTLHIKSQFQFSTCIACCPLN